VVVVLAACAPRPHLVVRVDRLDAPPDLVMLPGIAVVSSSDLARDRLRPVGPLTPAAREVLDGTSGGSAEPVTWLRVPALGEDEILVGVAGPARTIVAAALVSAGSAVLPRTRSVLLPDGLHRTTDASLDWDDVRFEHGRPSAGAVRVGGMLQRCSGEVELRAAAWRSGDAVAVLLQQRTCEEATGSTEQMEVELIGVEPGTALLDASRERLD